MGKDWREDHRIAAVAPLFAIYRKRKEVTVSSKFIGT